jgi:hypothetical protein
MNWSSAADMIVTTNNRSLAVIMDSDSGETRSRDVVR